MKAIAGGDQRAPIVSSVVLLGAIAALAASVVLNADLLMVSVGAIVLGILITAHKQLLQWHSLLAILVLVIMFIPVRRYVIPAGLPFELEPYRIVVVMLVAAWGTSLLIDPRVRLRRTGFEGPILLFLAAALFSVLANFQSISGQDLGAEVMKEYTFLVSFVLVFFFIVSAVRTRHQIDFLIKGFVTCGALIALLAIVESRTNYNAFDHLGGLPFLEPSAIGDVPGRGGRFRAQGPAEHAIGLSAAMALIAPLGLYLAITTRKARWVLATMSVGLGLFATVSRTGILMIVAAGFILLWLRPQETRRLWPLAIPALAAVHFAVPGTLGTIKDSFFPAGGLVEEQRGYNDSGRVGDLRPTLAQASKKPLFGQGIGTRITISDPLTGRSANSRVLDDQWLATLLETGVLGVLAWLWFFLSIVRRLGREAKRDSSERGWLLVALAASIGSFALGMIVFDAFSFVQETFLLYMLSGFAAVLLIGAKEPVSPRLAVASP